MGIAEEQMSTKLKGTGSSKYQLSLLVSTPVMSKSSMVILTRTFRIHIIYSLAYRGPSNYNPLGQAIIGNHGQVLDTANAEMRSRQSMSSPFKPLIAMACDLRAMMASNLPSSGGLPAPPLLSLQLIGHDLRQASNYSLVE